MWWLGRKPRVKLGCLVTLRGSALTKVSIPIRRHRLLLVTFDLTGTVSGDPRYALADTALANHGLVFKPVKQIRLLITQSISRRVKASLEQRIGRQATIFIAPLTSVPAWRIVGIEKRREWRAFVRAIEDHKVEVKFLTGDADSML